MLRIDSNILWTIINLLILYALMKHFLFQPVHDILEKRKQEIESDFALANQKKQEALESKNKRHSIRRWADAPRGNDCRAMPIRLLFFRCRRCCRRPPQSPPNGHTTGWQCSASTAANTRPHYTQAQSQIPTPLSHRLFFASHRFN